MRILIDTNILISGLFFHGLPKKLLSEMDFEKFNVCVNKEIVAEYIEKVDKKFSKAKYVLDKELRENFFSNLQKFEIKSDLKVCRDHDDDKFINCAIDAKAIYIVSGDNELFYLKCICDEIFGKSNFVSAMIWKNKSGGANDAKHIACDTEHILVYAKNISNLKLNKDTEAKVSTSYNKIDEDG